jgi:hypothetical protein
MPPERSLPTGAYTSNTGMLEYALARAAFLGSLEGDCVTFGISRSLRNTLVHIIEMVARAIYDVAGMRPRVVMLGRSLAYLQIDRAIFVKVEDNNHFNPDVWFSADRSIYVNGYGDERLVIALRKELGQIANQHRDVPKINLASYLKAGLSADCYDTV